jgi:hypothetical protein
MKSASFVYYNQNLTKCADLALFRPCAFKSRGKSEWFKKHALFKMTKTMGTGFDPTQGATISVCFGILSTDLKTVKTFLDTEFKHEKISLNRT